MIKLHENFKPKHETIIDNLKHELAEWNEEDSEILENGVASIITGTPVFDVSQDEVDYTNKYKKRNYQSFFTKLYFNSIELWSRYHSIILHF